MAAKKKTAAKKKKSAGARPAKCPPPPPNQADGSTPTKEELEQFRRCCAKMTPKEMCVYLYSLRDWLIHLRYTLRGIDWDDVRIHHGGMGGGGGVPTDPPPWPPA